MLAAGGISKSSWRETGTSDTEVGGRERGGQAEVCWSLPHG